MLMCNIRSSQRDVVWTDARQEGLIDSMFCNYFVPPVLVSAGFSPGLKCTDD